MDLNLAVNMIAGFYTGVFKKTDSKQWPMIFYRSFCMLFDHLFVKEILQIYVLNWFYNNK